jgi:2-dehydro-3-deoxyphosphogluconate aldolase/(4S)-4-hydroxy-2-oxoglutarate aldolase
VSSAEHDPAARLLARLRETRILPVVVLASPEHAVRLVQALLAAGVDTVEFTFRTAGAAEAIARVTADYPEVLVGAGTVLDAETARRAADAGAQFMLAPSVDPPTMAAAEADGIPFIPGAATPTEIHRALQLGAAAVKIFPASTLGGPAAVNALAAPFRHLTPQWVPTGGIDATNLADYLAIPDVAAVGGTWIAPPALQQAGDWAEITRRAQAAIDIGWRLGGT